MIIRDFNNNKIILKDRMINNIPALFKTKYKIYGHDNTIIIEDNVRLQKGQFVISGNYNYITIGSDSNINNFLIRADGVRNRVSIGKGIYFGGGCIHVMGRTQIRIGDNCLFSHEIDIRSGDGHSIYADGSRMKYNKEKNIIIGNHVWIGIRTQILKGVTIADGCIVGASSVVNKAFTESNCILAGYPARIIRKNISWEL